MELFVCEVFVVVVVVVFCCILYFTVWAAIYFTVLL